MVIEVAKVSEMRNSQRSVRNSRHISAGAKWRTVFDTRTTSLAWIVARALVIKPAGRETKVT